MLLVLVDRPFLESHQAQTADLPVNWRGNEQNEQRKRSGSYGKLPDQLTVEWQERDRSAGAKGFEQEWKLVINRVGYPVGRSLQGGYVWG